MNCNSCKRYTIKSKKVSGKPCGDRSEFKYIGSGKYIKEIHLCTLNPEWIKVSPNHYCGQYKYKHGV